MPKIMISSTAHDLPTHREAVREACRVLRHTPVMMEDLAALDADAIQASLAMVEEADIYLGIFAHRYGHIPTANNPHAISITEMEYRHAVAKHKPRLIFVVSDQHTPGLAHEQTPASQQKLREFIVRVKADRVVQFFNSPDHLRALVTEALVAWEKQEVRWMPEPLRDPDYLPGDGNLPPGSRVLVGRAEFFVGREDILVDIARSLLHTAASDTDEAKAVIKPAVATGAGGIGKTVLAVEFAHRYGRYFYGVHWINLFGVTEEELDAHLRSEIAANGQRMNLHNFPQDDLPRQMQMTMEAWRNTPPRLLILDNAESPQVVKKALRTLAGLRVLVTSRWGEDGDWRVIGVTPRPLDTLTRTQSITLLRKLAPHLRDLPDAELNRLAARLGDYPLAIHLAGRYLYRMRRAGGLSIDDYLGRLATEGVSHPTFSQSERVKDPTLAAHHDTVAHCLELSWDKVDDPLAQQLFRACGYLAPNQPIAPDLLIELASGIYDYPNVPHSLWHNMLKDPSYAASMQRDLTTEAAVADFIRRNGGDAKPEQIADLLRLVQNFDHVQRGEPEAVALALTQLVQYGLLAPYTDDEIEQDATSDSGERLAIHPLLADFARGLDAQRDEDERQLARVARALARATKQALDTELPAPFVPLRQHVEVTAAHADLAGSVTAAALWVNLAYYHQMIADFEASYHHLVRAVAIDERVYGPDHPEVAIDLNNLGGILRARGDLLAAKQHYERALAIDERAYGPDHPIVANRLNNLGLVLKDLGDLATARRYYERALAIDEREYGPDHPTVATRLNNLGGLLLALEDLSAARELFERALRIDERVYGSDHPIVAIRLNNLGSVLRGLGDLDAARRYYQRALTIDERVYGPNHPDVAIDLANLGSVLHDLGDLYGALEYLERVLAIDERVYGSDHPEVALDLNNLGSVLHDLGNVVRAEQYLERALRIYETRLPPGHARTARVRERLAALRTGGLTTLDQLRYFLSNLPGERAKRRS